MFDFLKKKKPKLHFAIAIADKDLADAKFEMGKDARIFIITGEVVAHDVIPRTTLKEAVERFSRPVPGAGMTVTEKPAEKS